MGSQGGIIKRSVFHCIVARVRNSELERERERERELGNPLILVCGKNQSTYPECLFCNSNNENL